MRLKHICRFHKCHRQSFVWCVTQLKRNGTFRAHIICEKVKPPFFPLVRLHLFASSAKTCNTSERISLQATRWLVPCISADGEKIIAAHEEGLRFQSYLTSACFLLWYATRLATVSSRLHISGVTCIAADRNTPQSHSKWKCHAGIKAHAAASGKAKRVTLRLVEHTHVQQRVHNISCSTRVQRFSILFSANFDCKSALAAVNIAHTCDVRRAARMHSATVAETGACEWIVALEVD